MARVRNPFSHYYIYISDETKLRSAKERHLIKQNIQIQKRNLHGWGGATLLELYRILFYLPIFSETRILSKFIEVLEVFVLKLLKLL